ncbi:MAG: GH92 family glycosyl hydrolase [Prevotella sp.]|nr:GH92 family glycosyl hydrolase [Prevotella sp.]
MVLFLACFVVSAKTDAGEHTKYVNPFIGTEAAANSLPGNTFPGAAMPFGMVQLSPDTQEAPDWDNASGYSYAHDTIYGFSHTHLSGTGACDLLDILMLPFSHDGEERPVEHFSHKEESACPGYYRVRLRDSGIEAELTATARTGMHRYTFGKGKRQRVFLDLDHSAPKGSWNRRIIDARVRIVSPTIIEGYRIITGWARLRAVYFRIEFSKPLKGHVLQDGDRREDKAEFVSGTKVRAFFDFDAKEGAELVCKVGISPVSPEGAQRALDEEAENMDFETCRNSADETWERMLSRIDVRGREKDKIMFYTALYHVMIQPNIMSDIDGKYVAPDHTIRTMAEGGTYYSTFSLWDTFRAVHPLYTILWPEYDAAFVESMLLHCEIAGYLPVWQLWGQDNHCMIGNHAVPVVVDAYMKGILPEADSSHVMAAVEASCGTSHQGLAVEVWEKYGYMPENVLSQSVSITLEQAFDDWCAALLAGKLGRGKTRERYLRRSEFYRNIFDEETGFFRAKDDRGNWTEPFDPLLYGANGGSPYTEGNAWQYLWYVPQDIPSLMTLMGGRKTFLEKLDEFFSLDARHGETNSNVSGFIGQYAQGNEPCHHVAYLYSMAGKPRHTEDIVHRIIRQMYDTSPGGCPGNDDCGQMSAWLVFSMMGFYPVNPVSGEFVLGTPVFDKVTINLPDGKKFKIIALRVNPTDWNVKKVRLKNDSGTETLKENTVRYDDIMRGGDLIFTII